MLKFYDNSRLRNVQFNRTRPKTQSKVHTIVQVYRTSQYKQGKVWISYVLNYKYTFRL